MTATFKFCVNFSFADPHLFGAGDMRPSHPGHKANSPRPVVRFGGRARQAHPPTALERRLDTFACGTGMKCNVYEMWIFRFVGHTKVRRTCYSRMYCKVGVVDLVNKQKTCG